jgi:hypothetical protein
MIETIEHMLFFYSLLNYPIGGGAYLLSLPDLVTVQEQEEQEIMGCL